jgi:hypothetical protein
LGYCALSRWLFPVTYFVRQRAPLAQEPVLQARAPLVQALKQVERQQLALVGEQSHLASDWSQQSQQLE